MLILEKDEKFKANILRFHFKKLEKKAKWTQRKQREGNNKNKSRKK